MSSQQRQKAEHFEVIQIKIQTHLKVEPKKRKAENQKQLYGQKKRRIFGATEKYKNIKNWTRNINLI